MAELIATLGIISSVGSIIDGTTKLIGYINETKNASKDARDFRQDAIEIQSLMFRLKYRLEDPDTSQAWLKETTRLEPLVDNLKDALLDFADEVQPVHGVRKVGRRFLWTLKKQDILPILNRIERLKSLINLVLTDNLLQFGWELNAAIKGEVLPKLERVESGLERVEGGVRRVDSGVKELQGQARRQRHQAIVDFIAPYDFATKHGSVLSQWQTGTGQWFLDAREYQDWIKSKPRKGNTLWCPGIPGAGKTTMVSIVVDDLQQRFREDKEVAIAFLYCDYRERETQTLQNMLSSFWKHFVQQRLLSNAECETLEKNFVKRNQRPQAAELLKLLFSEMQKYSKVYVILDALDECDKDHGTRLLKELRAFQPLVRIMITSRFPVGGDSALFDTTEQLRIRASTADLREYVDKRIENEAKLSNSVRKDPSLGQVIADTIAEKAQGMFLLARFHMDTLLEEHTPKKIRKALASLPQGEDALKTTYDDAMRRVEGQNKKDQQLAKRVIGFICYAKRPFTKAELQEALSVEEDDEDELDDDSLVPENLLTSLCAGLVTVDEAIGIIRFVHYTTQEYFEAVRDNLFPEAQLDMARTCLTYLRLESFNVELPDGNDGVGHMIKKHPFLGYASLYWGHHARESINPDDEDFNKEVEDFFDHRKNFNCATRALLLHPSGNIELVWYHNKGKGDFKPLNIAAYFGLKGVVSNLLKDLEVEDIEESGYVHSDDGFLGNALHWASIGDHEDVLKQLLDLPGTSSIMNVWGPNGCTSPLHEAINHQRLTAVRLLLEHGADVFQIRDDYGKQSCLELAIHKCPIEIIKVVLEADKERRLLKMNQFMDTSPFHIAAGLNRTDALQFMITLGEEAYGENIFRYSDIIDKHQRCPLHSAAEHGAAEAAQALLRHRLSDRLLAVRDRNGSNPFHIAIIQGGFAVTKAFLDVKGISLLDEKIGTDGGLHLATRRGEADIVQLLLELAPKSYHVNAHNSILHSAACSGSVQTVRVVLDETGNSLLERSDRYGKTPLHDATIRGHTEAVEFLLSRKANANAIDNAGRTSLHYAAVGSFVRLVKLLVKAGGALGVKDSEGNTPLLMGIKQRAVSSVHVLLKCGAKMPDVDEDLKAWISAQSWWREDGQYTSEAADYYPETSDDVFQVAYDLQRARGLPKELVYQILHDSEYWIRSDVQRAEQQLVNDYHGDVVYLQSQPIRGKKVEKIIFTITSHDQGWSDFTSDHGTYNGSWTWFSAWKLSGANKTQGPEILRNVHARREAKTHAVCWPRREGYHWHGADSEQVQNEWLRGLKEGDRVLIVAKAKYPGWTNFALRAEMSIFTSFI
ncbi:MAG: hypothetical protein Q9165_004864 [Trypethelium subeluteriae]